MGGVVPAGFSIAKKNVYENGLVLSPRALYRAGEPGARDVEPDLRQRPLRRDPRTGHAVDRRRARPRRAAARRDDRAVRRSGGAWGDDLRLRRRGRADVDGAGGDPRRHLGGRGPDRLRRRRRRRGVPRPRHGDEARRPRRGRLQRHLAAGAHLHQRDRRSTRRRRSGSHSSTSSTREGWFTSGAMRAVDLVIPEGTVVSALPARRRRLRLLGAEPGDALGGAARARAGGRARRRSRATAAAPTSTTRTACGRTARRGSRPPRSAARSAPTAATGTATPTRRCSRTRRTGSGSPSSRSSPTCRSSCCATRPCPTRPAPATTAAAPSMLRDSLWLAPAQHHLMSLRYKRAPGFGVHGGARRPTGGIWITDERPARRCHVAGHGRTASLPLPVPACRSGRRRPGAAAPRTSPHGGGGLGRPARARARARPARRPRRLRDDRGRRARLRCRRHRRPGRGSRGPRRRPRGDRAAAGSARR